MKRINHDFGQDFWAGADTQKKSPESCFKQNMTDGSITRERNGIYWKDLKDDLDGVTIPTPYLQQFSRFETNRHDAV